MVNYMSTHEENVHQANLATQRTLCQFARGCVQFMDLLAEGAPEPLAKLFLESLIHRTASQIVSQVMDSQFEIPVPSCN